MIDWSFAHHIDSAFEASRMTAKHYTVLSAPEMLEGPWLHLWLRKLELWGHPGLPREHAAAILVARGSTPDGGQLWAFVQPQRRRNTIYRAMPVQEKGSEQLADVPAIGAGQSRPPPQGKNEGCVLVGLRSEGETAAVLFACGVSRVVGGPVEWGRRGGASAEGSRRLAKWILGYAGYEESEERVCAVVGEIVMRLAPEFEENWAKLERRVGLLLSGIRTPAVSGTAETERLQVDVAISVAVAGGYGAWSSEVVRADGGRTRLSAGGRGVRERNGGMQALLETLRWLEGAGGGSCHLRVVVETAELVDDVLVRLPQWAGSGFADVEDGRRWREVNRRLAVHRSEWRVDRGDPGVLAARAYAATVLEEVRRVGPVDESPQQPVPSD